MVGVDTLAVTPADKQGNELLIVVINHFTKLVTYSLLDSMQLILLLMPCCSTSLTLGSVTT